MGKQIAAIVGLALLAATVSAFVHPKRPPWYRVQSAEELRWQIDLEQAAEFAVADDVVWIDARKREKFEEDHLEGAILLNPDDWGTLMFENMDALQSAMGKSVVVYCDGTRCEKSADVARRLRELLGLDPVYTLRGDWRKLRD